MTAMLFSYFSYACWVLAGLFACAFVFRLAKNEEWAGLALLSATTFILGIGLRYLASPAELPETIAKPLANYGVISPVVTSSGSSGSTASSSSNHSNFAPHLTPAPTGPAITPPYSFSSSSLSTSSWVSDMPAWLRGLLPPALRDPDATAQAFNQLLLSPAWQRLMANQTLWQQFPAMTDQEILNTPDVLMLLGEPGVVRLLDIWSGNDNASVNERNQTLVKLLREAAESGNSLLPNMPAVVALPALVSAVQQGDVMPLIASPYGQMLLSSVLPGNWSISFSQSGAGISLPPALGGQQPSTTAIVPNAKVYRFQMPDGSWRFSSVPPSDGRPYEEVQQ